MNQYKILIVHEDISAATLLASMLKSLGHPIEIAASTHAAVEILDRVQIDIVLAMPDMNAEEPFCLLTYMRRSHREIPVILLLAHVHPERSKEAIRMGAWSVLKFPVPAAELRATVMQAIELRKSRIQGASRPRPIEMPEEPTSSTLPSFTTSSRIESRADQSAMLRDFVPTPLAFSQEIPLRSMSDQPVSISEPSRSSVLGNDSQLSRPDPTRAELELIGKDSSLRQIVETSAAIASASIPVLIQGEAGTGKSLLSRIIHQMGKGSDRPFVTLHCTSLGETNQTSLFGVNRNSSQPDWSVDWSSKLNMARGGTLFLDEVAALPGELQVQLLRELQIRDYQALSSHSLMVDEIRFIMSTSENLPALVEQGQFRQELFHRISGVSLALPPLRRRGADIEQLAEHFRARFAREYQKNVAGFTSDAMDLMHRHEWPGNLRELEGVIQRAVAL